MLSELDGEKQTTVLEALPYYDNDLDLHPMLRQKVEAELTRESRNQPSTLHPKVPCAYELFTQNHPLLKAELERVESHRPAQPLDTVRHQLPAPAVSGTAEEWQAALKNAKAQLEHQRIRQSNIALLQKYGANAWRIRNHLLEHTAIQLEKGLEELKERTVDVNRQRNQFQTKLGAQLTALETRWTELISNVLQIELANAALEAEISDLTDTSVEHSSMFSSLHET